MRAETGLTVWDPKKLQKIVMEKFQGLKSLMGDKNKDLTQR